MKRVYLTICAILEYYNSMQSYNANIEFNPITPKKEQNIAAILSLYCFHIKIKQKTYKYAYSLIGIIRFIRL